MRPNAPYFSVTLSSARQFYLSVVEYWWLVGQQTYLPMSLVNSLAALALCAQMLPTLVFTLSNARQFYSAVVEYTGGYPSLYVSMHLEIAPYFSIYSV
jgi:hypothetical protein